MAGGGFFFSTYSNPWIFAVIQPIMGTTTLFSGNCEISNPTLSCALESPESLETTGIAGRCDPEVGCIATPPPFSCFLFDLAKPSSKPVILRLAHIGSTLARHGLRRCGVSAFPTQPRKPRHGAAQGPTGGNRWQRKSAPRFAMHSGLAFIFLSSVPDIDVVAVPISGLVPDPYVGDIRVVRIPI